MSCNYKWGDECMLHWDGIGTPDCCIEDGCKMWTDDDDVEDYNVHGVRNFSDKQREELKRGCVHPEDTWTKWWCGDCGAYSEVNGCRGPKGVQ